MSTRIIEYGGAQRVDDLQVIPMELSVQSPITASASSQQSSAAGAGTNMVCVDTDEAIYVSVGSNPTATSSHKKIAAGDYRFFQIEPGYKIAVLAA